jgi:ribosomal protein S18 acetylase RimI-like enzyme
VSLVVRPIEPGDDHEAAGAIVQRAYFRLPGYPRDDEYDATLGDVVGRSQDSTVLVALDGTRIVGCLTFVEGMHNPHAEFDDAHAASFRYFGVDPSVQGRGVGEAMVQWCLDRARADGMLRVRIHTLESMPAAQRLYLRMGFLRDEANDEDWDGIKGLAFIAHL